MNYVAEIGVPFIGKHPAGRSPLPIGPDEEFTDRRVEAVILGDIPGPPAGVIWVGGMANGGVDVHRGISGGNWVH
jgi:hypothetical protein